MEIEDFFCRLPNLTDTILQSIDLLHIVLNNKGGVSEISSDFFCKLLEAILGSDSQIKNKLLMIFKDY